MGNSHRAQLPEATGHGLLKLHGGRTAVEGSLAHLWLIPGFSDLVCKVLNQISLLQAFFTLS